MVHQMHFEIRDHIIPKFIHIKLGKKQQTTATCLNFAPGLFLSLNHRYKFGFFLFRKQFLL